MIWIVEKDGIVKKKRADITVKEAGQKAYGLCKMPTLWTLPFFIIDKNFYLSVCKEDTNTVNKLKRFLKMLICMKRLSFVLQGNLRGWMREVDMNLSL